MITCKIWNFLFFSPQRNCINSLKEITSIIYSTSKKIGNIYYQLKRIIRVFGLQAKKVGKAELFRLKYSVINSYSENFALRNSRLRRAMWSMEIPLGHSISQARVFVQLPNPSSSIFATIFLALLAASGRP